MRRGKSFVGICVSLILMGLIFIYQISAQERGGLVLFLPFEEGSGGTTKDLSGNGNHGEISGGANWINGKSGYAEVPDDDSLDFTEAITVEFWVKPNADWANNNWYGLVFKGQMGAEALGVDKPNFFLSQTHPQDGANQIEWAYFHASNDNDWLPSQSSLDIGTWYHIAGVIDIKNGRWEIYINGELDVERDISNDPLQSDDEKLWIVNGWAFFNGTIDEVADTAEP